MAGRSGDDPDFEEFVAARSRSLFRTAYLLTGSRESAEDLLQSAFERAYPRWRRIRRADQPEAYVRRMIVNLANDGWRRGRLREQELTEEHLAATERRTPAADPADRLAVRDQLMAALRGLPFQMRAVLVLRYWEGLSEQEASALLGVSTGTVKSQASRGLGRLRTALAGTDDLEPALAGRTDGSWP